MSVCTVSEVFQPLKRVIDNIFDNDIKINTIKCNLCSRYYKCCRAFNVQFSVPRLICWYKKY